MSAIKLFWWAPSRDPRLAWPELKTNPGVWVRLAARTGRVGTNFGDELSSHIVEAVTGRKVEWAAPLRADLVAVGSVLGLYASQGSGAAVWGSGLREPVGRQESQELLSSLGPILAVRGINTRTVLGLPESTALGDPGVLAPLFRKVPSTRQRKILVIPHFRAWANASGRQSLKQISGTSINVAEPTLHPKVMIQRICDSSLVLTSSLHGLILGHSLGIPTQLVTWNGAGLQEPDFKYQDYASSLNRKISTVPIQDVFDPMKLKVIHERCEKEVAAISSSTSLLAEGLIAAISAL